MRLFRLSNNKKSGIVIKKMATVPEPMYLLASVERSSGRVNPNTISPRLPINKSSKTVLRVALDGLIHLRLKGF